MHAAFALALLLAVPPLAAQSSAPHPTFEVASVKRHAGGEINGRRHLSPTEFTEINVTAMSLVHQAYGLHMISQIKGGPAWFLDPSERYDVLAKTGASVSREEMMVRLRSLLEDRFKLKIHRETKEDPAYILSVAKGGLKLKRFNDSDCAPPNPNPQMPARDTGAKPVCGMFLATSKGSDRALDATGATMAVLTRWLSIQLERYVVDRTGIEGRLGTIHLEYPAVSRDSGDLSGEVAAALKNQIGLRLESGKAPVEFLIVDRIEKPTEN